MSDLPCSIPTQPCRRGRRFWARVYFIDTLTRMNGGRGSKQILIHGMSLVLVGMIWGLVVPHTAYPRLALSAHVGFEGNGVLFIVVAGLLLDAA